MSDKTIKWYGDGIYSKARDGLETFYARLWVPSVGKMATWKLKGRTLEQAKRDRQRLGDSDKAWAARQERRAARKVQKAAAFTVAQMFDAFKREYRSRGGSGFHAEIIKAAREFFENRPAATLTPDDVEAYVRHRKSLRRQSDGERRVSDSTIRKEIIGIGTAYKWAKRHGFVQMNPVDPDSVARPSGPFREARGLSENELAGLRSVSSPWLRNVIGWATETGMDKRKILRLCWPELDLERMDGRIVAGRFAMQRDKTGKPVRQVLSAGAIEALNAAGKIRHASGVVFLDDAGQPIQKKALDWALGCAYKAAGITGCNFRTFRHTFATRALRRGVPREVLAKMMGHSTAFITERYMHVADDQLDAAAKALAGPERLAGRGTIPGAGSPTGAGTGAGPAATDEATAQVLAYQARRGTEAVITGPPRKRVGA